MEVDAHSTDIDAYPQLIVSTADIPVQNNLASGTSVVVEPIGINPTELQIQLCAPSLGGEQTSARTGTSPPRPRRQTDARAEPEVAGQDGRPIGPLLRGLRVDEARVRLVRRGAVWLRPTLPRDASRFATTTLRRRLYHSASTSPTGSRSTKPTTRSSRRATSNLGFASHRPLPLDRLALPCVPANALK